MMATGASTPHEAEGAAVAGTTGTRRHGRVFPWGFAVILVLISLNLRSPFVAVAPIAARLREELGVGGAGIGLLTSLPVLCFGLFPPLALLVIRRTGVERAVVACLASVVVGSAIRSADGYAGTVVGTLVIGLGLTVGNVVVPVLIRRETSPAFAGAMTGVYVSAMNVGSMLVSVATVPVETWGGWRTALAVWALLALVGLVTWELFRRRRRRLAAGAPPPPPAAPPEESTPPWRTPVGWLLALAFAGQATSYYALTAWLPTLLADEIGLRADAAGAASSVFQISAIAGALGVPLLALRLPAWGAIGVVAALWVSLPVLLLAAPHLYLLGSVLGGTAQGGGFAALFTVVVHVASSDREGAHLSAFVQTVGYVVAATGPTVLGVLHDATDDWTAPLLVVLGTTLTFTVMGVAAGTRAQLTHG